MLICFLKRLCIGISLLVMTTNAQADSVTTQETSSRSFIAFKNLNMNFRSTTSINGTPMGALGRGSMIQLPDSFGVFNSTSGELDLRATVNNWETNTRDGRFKSLAPKPCAGTTCVPVRVHKSSNPNIPDGTIGYISLKYIQQHVDNSRYVSGRTAQETTTNFNKNDVNVTTANPTGGEVTDPDTASPTTTYNSNNIYNCDDTGFTSRGYASNNCLTRKGFSLKQKVELVMKDVLEINRRRPVFKMEPRLSACMVHRESGFSPNAKGGTPDWGMYQVIDDTGRRTLNRTKPVVEGFKDLSWTDFRNKMIKSTLAQADLHHNVVYQKAREGGGANLRALNAVMNGNASRVGSGTILNLAGRYNGSGSGGTYARKISSCYTCLTGIATKDGNVTNEGALAGCLRRAK